MDGRDLEPGGSPRMHRDLVDEGHETGRHRTARLMHGNQLIARQKRRFKRTTDDGRRARLACRAEPLGAGLHGGRPGQEMGADISYIWTAEG